MQKRQRIKVKSTLLYGTITEVYGIENKSVWVRLDGGKVSEFNENQLCKTELQRIKDFRSKIDLYFDNFNGSTAKKIVILACLFCMGFLSAIFILA